MTPSRIPNPKSYSLQSTAYSLSPTVGAINIGALRVTMISEHLITIDLILGQSWI